MFTNERIYNISDEYIFKIIDININCIPEIWRNFKNKMCKKSLSCSLNFTCLLMYSLKKTLVQLDLLEKQKLSSFSVFSLTSIRKFNVSYAISVQKFRGFIRNTRTFFARLAAFQGGWLNVELPLSTRQILWIYIPIKQ